MALARIFSCSPEQATALIQDLERQGYKVEVLRPEETPSGHADLEIQYELCDTNGAVERAQELASEYHADVAVESIALQTTFTEAAQLSELPQEKISEPVLGDRTDEKSAPPLSSVDAVHQPQEVPVDNDFEEQSWTAQQHMDAETSRRELASELEPAQQNIQIEHRPAHPLVAAWTRGATVLIAAAGNVAQTSRTLWFAGLQKMREQRERASIHAAEARADREQRLLELTCKRAEALQRSRQLEAARRAAAGYLTQLQREESGDGPDESAAQENAPMVPAAKAQKDLNIWWSPSQHVKNIAAGAAAAGVLFALTLGISALRNKPSTAKASQPAVIASPAAVQTPSVTVETSTGVPDQDASRPSPAIRKTSHTKARQAVSVSPKAGARQSAAADDDVADDVVVRHFSKPQQKLQSRVGDGVKHYSDDEN
jgi:hypothetical protein